jgi:ubiquinone/menaquinone biosynthesis C-methylase UbiE
VTATFRDSLLGRAGWYHRWKQFLKAENSTRRFVDEYVRPNEGDHVLDVGCGDGDIRPLLGKVHYVGIDSNPNYLAVASARTDSTTRFVQANVADLSELNVGPFDIAIAVGLLHHISDESAEMLLSGLRDVLVPGGRLVTLDPVFSPDQKTSARVLAALDRGRYVRDEGGYVRLVAQHLTVTRHLVRHDLLWFPYSHCTIEATVSSDQRAADDT